MLTKEDKIKQAKAAIVYIVSLLKKVAPGLDFNELKIGRDRDLGGDETRIYLYFQQCLKSDGTPTTLDNLDGRQATHYKEIQELGNKIRNLNKDLYITSCGGGTFSGLKTVPNFTPPSPSTSYYGLAFTVTFKEFKPGTIVKVKSQGLDPGENPDTEYEVIEQHNNRISVKLAKPDPKRAIQGTGTGPAHSVYSI